MEKEVKWSINCSPSPTIYKITSALHPALNLHVTILIIMTDHIIFIIIGYTGSIFLARKSLIQTQNLEV